MCPLRGEVEPLRRTTLLHKSNKKPNNKNPPRIIHQTTQPRSTPTPPTTDNPQAAKWPKCLTTYIPCHFQFHVTCILLCLQRTFISPRVWSKPTRRASAKYMLILTKLTTLSQATLAYIRRSSQIRYFTLDSCHCSWLNNLSINSIPNCPISDALEKVPILIFLANFLKIFPLKKACF